MAIANEYGINLPAIYDMALRTKSLKEKQKMQEMNIIRKPLFPNYKKQKENNEEVTSKNHIISLMPDRFLEQQAIDSITNHGMNISKEMDMKWLKQTNPNLSDKDIETVANKNAKNFKSELQKYLSAPPRTREAYNELINTYARQLYTIDQMPPEQREGAYQMFRNQIPEEERANVPEHYDPIWAKMEMARAHFVFSAAQKMDLARQAYMKKAALAQQEFENKKRLKEQDLKNKENLTKLKFEEQQKLLGQSFKNKKVLNYQDFENKKKLKEQDLKNNLAYISYKNKLFKSNLNLKNSLRNKTAKTQTKGTKQLSNITVSTDSKIRNMWKDYFSLKITDPDKLNTVVDAATLLMEKYLKQGLTPTQAKIQAEKELLNKKPNNAAKKNKSEYVKDKSGKVYKLNHATGKYELYTGG